MVKIIHRQIQENIEKTLFKGKIVVIYGARQVGKTTLVREIMNQYPDDSAYFNCDEPDIRSNLIDKTSTELKNFLGNKKLIILDEAQRVANIGLTLKLLIDNFPATQIIATGSSSFDLANKIIEPLTGRKYEFYLYPLSVSELKSVYSDLEINRLLEHRIIFGMYPEIVTSADDVERKLKTLTSSYLYRDILTFDKIKNSDNINKLLQALALQISNEVSYNELADMVGINKNTVKSYIEILEKSFIIFRLNPFSRNLRNELKKMRKIYFYDTGIRNALINNLNSISLRQDTGALWENFLISERMKLNYNNNINTNMYFWRTQEGKEIDYLEESNGQILGFELKWAKDKFKNPKAFLTAYPDSSLKLINKDNYQEFLF